MSGIFHIRRIRLINFHNFVDETLPVRRNLFLVGDNQSGKTTVLDAVHFALTAGVDMEFNAAARFGPRSDAGRNLASIVLRYDLEKDVALRGQCVAYAAVEVREEDDVTFHTFGVGVYATSIDAQPEVWGFIARAKGLDEVGLVVEETCPDGVVRPRPVDRAELEEILGRDKVFDKGRYRTALAQFLYRDRDDYQRVMELITAAKSYRELVARARNLDDLFIGLLPPPAESEFREVRDALRAIDGIQADLDDLESELGILRNILERLGDARRETEKIARYEYVGAELAMREARQDHDEASAALEEGRLSVGSATDRLASAESRESALADSLRTVQGGEGYALVEREAESRRDLEAAETRPGQSPGGSAAEGRGSEAGPRCFRGSPAVSGRCAAPGAGSRPEVVGRGLPLRLGGGPGRRRVCRCRVGDRGRRPVRFCRDPETVSNLARRPFRGCTRGRSDGSPRGRGVPALPRRGPREGTRGPCRTGEGRGASRHTVLRGVARRFAGTGGRCGPLLSSPRIVSELPESAGSVPRMFPWAARPRGRGGARVMLRRGKGGCSRARTWRRDPRCGGSSETTGPRRAGYVARVPRDRRRRRAGFPRACPTWRASPEM